jgi:dienelactone hydrolase
LATLEWALYHKEKWKIVTRLRRWKYFIFSFHNKGDRMKKQLFKTKSLLFLIVTVNIVAWNSTCFSTELMREAPEKYWDFSKLKDAPKYEKVNFKDSKFPNLETIMFEGMAVEGKPAPVFAYVGYPQSPVPQGGFPSIVLVHGGGGTAFPRHVRFWNEKGFAVIALDWYNQRPIVNNNKVVKRVPLAGGKRQEHVVIVGNVILCTSLLRTLPKVNPDKIALVGLSWGSWYGAMVASVDPRLKGVIEIYLGDRKTDKSFINGRFLHAARVPMYWVAGTNDRFATPESLQRAFDECPTIQNKSLVIELPHGDGGVTFESCVRMADYFLKGAPPLPKLGKAVLEKGIVTADILQEGKGIKYAVLCYTTSSKEKISHKRKWESVPAQVKGKRVSAKLPSGTFQCFLSVYDQQSEFNDCCGSSNVLFLH